MQTTGHYDARIFGERYGGLDGLQARANDLGPAAVVGMEERLDVKGNPNFPRYGN